MAGASMSAKVPRERIGALVGPNGSVKELIEKRLSVGLAIDSETGDVTITLAKGADDPSRLFRAREVVNAIGRGFSPERTFRLLEDEDAVLEFIDLRDFVGRSETDIKRLSGRIIGKDGKTRMIIEELTDASVCVYGHTIGIIGTMEQVEAAREAVQMLIKGKQHGTVYRFLHKKRRELKKKKLEIWETPFEDME